MKTPLPSKLEFWRLVIPAIVVGMLLRLDLDKRLGLNQFDEGVYAFAARWPFQGSGLLGIDPGLIPYAPAGYPILVGMLAILLGPSDQTSFLTSALAGSFTILSATAIARRILGDRSAVAVAWIVSCSGPHIAMSRSGLTDASFLFIWSLGWLAALRFLDRPGWSTATAMGLFVGLAQNLKYNGWLLGGMIIATAASEALTRSGRGIARQGRLFGWGLLGAVVATAVVLPWFVFVESHGGYAGLLAHQRSYLGGASGWWPNLRAQADQAVALGGPAWLLVLCASLVGLTQAWTRRTERMPILSGIVAASTTLMLAAAPATTFLAQLVTTQRFPPLGRRFLLVNGVVLFILTPFYHPYARLWLPFELVHWLVLGDLIARLGDAETWEGGPRFSRSPRGPIAAAAIMVLLSATWGSGFPLAGPGTMGQPGLFTPTDSLRRVADDVIQVVPRDAAEVRTLVRPSLSYYFGGRIPSRPQPSLDGLLRDPGPGSWALIDSTIVGGGQGGAVDSTLDGAVVVGQPWERVARFEAANSLITTLDLDPSARGGPTVAHFWLLRSRPQGNPE